MSTKYYQNISTMKKLWGAQEFGLEIRSGEIMKINASYVLPACDTRVLQKVLSLGSDNFSATFY